MLLRTFLTLLLVALPLAGQARPVTTSTSTIELNTAQPELLERLPGIGPMRARRIVERRERRRFRRVRELLGIRGIGPKTFRKLKHLVRVDPKEGRKSD